MWTRTFHLFPSLHTLLHFPTHTHAHTPQNVEIASLSSQVASLHKQLDSQREASKELKVQLSSVTSTAKGDQKREDGEREAGSNEELEGQLQKLRTEVASMSAQCAEKDKRITDLKGGLSEALPKLLEAEKHITTLKEDLKTKEESIAALESEVKLRKETEEALIQGMEEAERKWEEEKERCVQVPSGTELLV